MPEGVKRGVFARQTLTAAELADVTALAGACMQYEDIDLRLSWNALQSRSSDVPEHFLCYQGGALAGFLTLDGLGSAEVEAGGMVHPAHRREGLFTTLVAAAREVGRQNGAETLVFVCDRRSVAAKACLEALGAAYDMTEQKMRLDPPGKTFPADSQLDFRQATIADADAITQIIADDSGMDATYFRQIVVRGIQTGARQFYVAKLGGETIGTIAVDVIDGDTYIYGFVIRPERRGRGYGKQMLARTIADIIADRPQPIFLEVETDNTAALALYHSFGFVVMRTYDYYRIET